LILCFLGTLPVSATAQDANYWSQQYGTRAELLGGAVVGSLSDLSATFYNPGALAVMERPSVLLSAEAFEYQVLTLHDAGAEGSDIRTTRFDTAPSLFTGLFPSKWLPGQLAYVLLTRSQFRFRLLSRGEGLRDVLSPPGAEFVAGEGIAEQSLSENWGGVNWTHAIGDRVGIGFTQFVGYRGQRTRTQAQISASSSSGAGGASSSVKEFDYWHYRLVTKIGVAFDSSPLTVGMAATLPSVTLFGRGKTYSSLSSAGFDLDGSGTADSYLAANSQENLGTKYRSPFSLAAGMSYAYKRSAVHFTMEWFNNTREYTVVKAEPFVVQSTGAVVDPSVTAETDDVVNVGAGFQYEARERLTFYTSVTTDYSAAVPGSETKHTISTWDIYHWTLGAAFTIAGLDLTLGGGFAWGDDRVEVFDPASGRESDGLIAGRKSVPVTYRKAKMFGGFAFGL